MTELKIKKLEQDITCYDCVQLGDKGVQARHKIIIVTVSNDLLTSDIVLRDSRTTIHNDGKVCWSEENVQKGTITINMYSVIDAEDDVSVRLNKEQAVVFLEILQFAIDNMEKAWEV